MSTASFNWKFLDELENVLSKIKLTTYSYSVENNKNYDYFFNIKYIVLNARRVESKNLRLRPQNRFFGIIFSDKIYISSKI